VILDHFMPVMTGVQFVQQLRANGEFADLPMILLTGLGQQSQAPADKTFFAILTKPLKPHQLKSAVLRALTAGRHDEPAIPVLLPSLPRIARKIAVC